MISTPQDMTGFASFYSSLANRSGGLSASMRRRGGVDLFIDGPFKGKSEGEAEESARLQWAAMKPEQRRPWAEREAAQTSPTEAAPINATPDDPMEWRPGVSGGSMILKRKSEWAALDAAKRGGAQQSPPGNPFGNQIAQIAAGAALLPNPATAGIGAVLAGQAAATAPSAPKPTTTGGLQRPPSRIDGIPGRQWFQQRADQDGKANAFAAAPPVQGPAVSPGGAVVGQATPTAPTAPPKPLQPAGHIRAEQVTEYTLPSLARSRSIPPAGGGGRVPTPTPPRAPQMVPTGEATVPGDTPEEQAAIQRRLTKLVSSGIAPPSTKPSVLTYLASPVANMTNPASQVPMMRKALPGFAGSVGGTTWDTYKHNVGIMDRALSAEGNMEVQKNPDYKPTDGLTVPKHRFVLKPPATIARSAIPASHPAAGLLRRPTNTRITGGASNLILK